MSRFNLVVIKSFVVEFNGTESEFEAFIASSDFTPDMIPDCEEAVALCSESFTHSVHPVEDNGDHLNLKCSCGNLIGKLFCNDCN